MEIAKTIEDGLVYIEFSCGCIFLGKEDMKRKHRSVSKIKNGRRTHRVFCPLHKSSSWFKSRFKICPTCKSKVIVANNTLEGNCSACACVERMDKKESIKPNEPEPEPEPEPEKSIKSDCLQYGKKYFLKRNEKIIVEPLCRNRSYCLSFINRYTTLLQCANCSHVQNNLFGD